MGFSRQEYWSGLPFPPPGDLPDPGIEPMSPASPALAGRFFYHWAIWGCLYTINFQVSASLSISPTGPPFSATAGSHGDPPRKWAFLSEPLIEITSVPASCLLRCVQPQKPSVALLIHTPMAFLSVKCCCLPGAGLLLEVPQTHPGHCHLPRLRARFSGTQRHPLTSLAAEYVGMTLKTFYLLGRL